MGTRTLSFVVSLLLAGACSSAPTSPTTDFITVQSIVPASGTTLVAGERVTFTAVLNCTVATGTSGLTALVLQDQRNALLGDSGDRQAEATLQKGNSTVTLSQTITIPESGSTVNALFPIFIDGRESTQAVAVNRYPVR